MGKNKISAYDIEKIQHLSYTELGKAVVNEDYSIKDLRRAYSQMRDIAVKRIQRLESPKNVAQFGQPEKEYFRTTKSLTTSSELLKEIRDISRFLTTKKTTISGLREQRNFLIDKMKEEGFQVEKSDYPQLVKFMRWFKSSEYSKKYDSDSPEVAQVFNTEKPNEEDWRKAFEALKGTEKPSPVRKY